MKHNFSVILCTILCISASFAQINDLAKTPPMGWNSWNVFHENINEKQIHEIADVMVSSGMRDAGYIYLNLDDNWMAKTRDANGNLQADPTRFPSGMKALGDYIHSKGLKFGIYGDRGLRTCHHYNNSSSFPNSQSGSYLKEERDAKMFASWGVDYLKYDNCEPASGSNQQQDYERMRDALLNSGRDIVFSICAWGYQDWMPKTGNLWRTTGDIGNAWSIPTGFFRGIVEIVDENEKHYTVAGPGHWNDPDMLQVGNGVLTMDESRAHITMWAMMAAPLLTGSDLRSMTTEVKSIYMNAEMIAVDQDSAGIAGHRLSAENSKEIWVRPLGSETSGVMAVALFNRNSSAATIDLDFSKLGISGDVTVRDIWNKKDLGVLNGSLSAEVPAHGTAFLKISSKIVPQGPFDSLHIAAIPGKIEAENYDAGNSGLAYYDKDSENKGGEYREDGVDITKDSAGNYIVGYTEAEEWLEYTVNVKAKGTYNFSARVSSGADNSSFMLFVDDKAIADTVKVPNGGNWDTYTEVSGKTSEIAEGSHILKILITGNYANLDWIEFKDTNTTSIQNRIAFNQSAISGYATYDVFDFCGKHLGTFRSLAQTNLSQGTQRIVRKAGVYLVKARNGTITYKVSVTK
ncbi:MAG: carbohydrate-binding protein [Fibrobacteraceae bacterium]|nr:carbohydrate-binding protein [Fibrobacteraceae bacterium]